MACGWQNSCRPRSCNYLQNVGATTYKNFLQFYAKKACKKHNCAAADFVSATAIIIGYATLTHIYDSKNCSTVLHNCMLLSRLFLLRENYTTINLTPMFRAGTPVEQCAHTVSSEMLTPVGRNLHSSFLSNLYCLFLVLFYT